MSSNYPQKKKKKCPVLHSSLMYASKSSQKAVGKVIEKIKAWGATGVSGDAVNLIS
jgi:hypothetical protein